jgi:cell shape-determining protein MreD
MRNIFLVAGIVLAASVVLAFRMVLLAIGSALYVYLLPGVVAQKRHHPRCREIFIVTALSAWLVLPWLLALLYAVKADPAGADYDDLPLVAGFADD